MGVGVERRLWGENDGQESESPSWCRAPHGALLTHIQRFESPAPAWVTLKQIPAWHSVLSSGSREIDHGKVTPYSQSNSGSLALPQTRYWALSSPFPSSAAQLLPPHHCPRADSEGAHPHPGGSPP